MIHFREKKTTCYEIINKTNIKNIKPILDKYIELEEAKLYTDESPVYKGYEREAVNHSKGEYKNGNATTNSIEGTFGLFKRRIYGIHHQITKAHIDKYINSFVFYFNNRAVEISERFKNFLEEFDLSNIRFLEITVTKNNEKYTYYIVSCIEDIEIVNFSQSTFIGDNSSPALRKGGDVIKTDSYDDYSKKATDIWYEKGFGFVLVPI